MARGGGSNYEPFGHDFQSPQLRLWERERERVYTSLNTRIPKTQLQKTKENNIKEKKVQNPLETHVTAATNTTQSRTPTLVSKENWHQIPSEKSVSGGNSVQSQVFLNFILALRDLRPLSNIRSSYYITHFFVVLSIKDQISLSTRKKEVKIGSFLCQLLHQWASSTHNDVIRNSQSAPLRPPATGYKQIHLQENKPQASVRFA